MSEQYRVDEGESGYYFIVDQKKGRRLRVENKMQEYMQTIADLLNQQAAELREVERDRDAMLAAIVQWYAVTEDDDCSMDDAIVVCDALAAFAVRKAVGGTGNE